jgi:hypothetical protein
MSEYVIYLVVDKEKDSFILFNDRMVPVALDSCVLKDYVVKEDGYNLYQVMKGHAYIFDGRVFIRLENGIYIGSKAVDPHIQDKLTRIINETKMFFGQLECRFENEKTLALDPFYTVYVVYNKLKESLALFNQEFLRIDIKDKILDFHHIMDTRFSLGDLVRGQPFTNTNEGFLNIQVDQCDANGYINFNKVDLEIQEKLTKIMNELDSPAKTKEEPKEAYACVGTRFIFPSCPTIVERVYIHYQDNLLTMYAKMKSYSEQYRMIVHAQKSQYGKWMIHLEYVDPSKVYNDIAELLEFTDFSVNSEGNLVFEDRGQYCSTIIFKDEIDKSIKDQLKQTSNE